MANAASKLDLARREIAALGQKIADVAEDDAFGAATAGRTMMREGLRRYSGSASDNRPCSRCTMPSTRKARLSARRSPSAR